MVVLFHRITQRWMCPLQKITLFSIDNLQFEALAEFWELEGFIENQVDSSLRLKLFYILFSILTNEVYELLEILEILAFKCDVPYVRDPSKLVYKKYLKKNYTFYKS